VGVSWSDDDYQTFTAEQTVSLNQERPIIQDGSTFRRRAYKITHNANTFLRLKAIQLNILGGTQ
jgi:hypothetical protein